MRKIFHIIFLFTFFLVGCTPALERQQRAAEVQTEHVIRAIQSGVMDSVWMAVRESSRPIFLIYSNGQLIFWSTNNLSAHQLPVPDYSQGWHDFAFDNADTRVLWTRSDNLEVMTILPQVWHVDGQEALEKSFSFLPLRQQEDMDWWQATRIRARAYSIILFLIILVTVLAVGWLLWKNHGFGNMNLRDKIMVVMTTALIGFCSILVFSVVRFERLRYADQQAQHLMESCMHVQSSLQSLYYWDFFLSGFHSAGLNVDLRDLAHSYGSDIHVYDLEGNLLGSSTPQLFQEGLLSHHMAPEVLFSDQGTCVVEEFVGNVKYIAAYTAFYNGSHVQIGYISMPFFMSSEARDAEIDMVLARVLPPLIIMLLLMFVFSVVFAHRLTRPIMAMIDKMQNLQPNARDNHIDYRYHDELGLLVEHYNEMVDRLSEYTLRLASSEREGAWRTMARQIAHEINNPLTPMKLTIQQLQRCKGQPNFEQQFDRATNVLVQQIDNLGRIASSFSTFARMPDVKASWVDIAERVHTVIELYQNNPEQIPVRYVGPDCGIYAWADGESIVQVFTNIIRNAIQALANQSDGDVIVSLVTTEEEVQIRISDNGPGIPDEYVERIFTPNFTTKSNGTGLGLAISKNIVESCGGRILFESAKKGAIFLVCLKKKM